MNNLSCTTSYVSWPEGERQGNVDLHLCNNKTPSVAPEPLPFLSVAARAPSRLSPAGQTREGRRETRPGNEWEERDEGVSERGKERDKGTSVWSSRGE